MLNRRQFLSVAASGVTLAQPASKLAEDGDRPVREKPLKADYWGTRFYDEKELEQLTEVHSSRQPFRWYGPGNQPPTKVATFETEWANRMQTRFALAVTSGTAALRRRIPKTCRQSGTDARPHSVLYLTVYSSQ